MSTTSVLRGGTAVIDQLEPEWQALCDEGPCDEPFYRPEWFRAYARAFVPDHPLVLIALRSAGRLRAVLPLVQDTWPVAGVPVQRLRAAANVHSCRFDLVHGSDDDLQGLVRTIWDTLRETPGWDLLDCPYVPATGAFPRLALLAATDGYPIEVRPIWRSPYLTLPGGDFSPESVLEHLDSKFRANLRRRRRNLTTENPVRLAAYTQATQAILDRFYRLECAGWKGKAGSAIACDGRVKQFYDMIGREAERFGYLALYALEQADTTVAMHYGLARHGRYFLLKPAYDETFSRYSPGQLLIESILRDLVAGAFHEFDFLGPMMEWKQDWTETVRPHDRWYVFNASLLGRSAHAVRFRILPALKRGVGRFRATGASGR